MGKVHLGNLYPQGGWELIAVAVCDPLGPTKVVVRTELAEQFASASCHQCRLQSAGQREDRSKQRLHYHAAVEEQAAPHGHTPLQREWAVAVHSADTLPELVRGQVDAPVRSSS